MLRIHSLGIDGSDGYPMLLLVVLPSLSLPVEEVPLMILLVMKEGRYDIDRQRMLLMVCMCGEEKGQMCVRVGMRQ